MFRTTSRLPRFGAYVALGLLLAFGSTFAVCDVISFNLSTGNSTLSGFPGPYASVTVNRTSTTQAMITFDSLITGGNLYLMAGNSAADVNVNASSFTVSGLTGSNSQSGFSFTPANLSNGGSGNVDGFGVFNLNINDFDGFTHSTTEIVFTLTNGSGSWASASSVLLANANGGTAAVHGFVCADNPLGTCTGSSGALATGYGSNGAATPEPASMALLGTGLFGLGAWRRRK